jgi:hypothetical protein
MESEFSRLQAATHHRNRVLIEQSGMGLLTLPYGNAAVKSSRC